jgi:hypothetical protein
MLKYVAKILNETNEKKILIEPTKNEKTKLIADGTPFWEVEIYPTNSIFYRLVFNAIEINIRKLFILLVKIMEKRLLTLKQKSNLLHK